MKTASMTTVTTKSTTLKFDRSDLAQRFSQAVTLDEPSASVAWLAQQLWLALEAGHTALSHSFVCKGLSEAGFILEPALEAIRAHIAVQQEQEFLDDRPIVFGYGHWYLQRYAGLEQGIARALRALDREQPFAPHPSIDAALTRLNELQGQALVRATQRRLLILSGGPGTGKTFTLASIVSALRDALASSAQNFRVVACAPTGKAAVRLANQGIGFDQVSTIQRLLSSPRTIDGFIDADLVVVDEASMLDATLASEFFGAIGPTTRLILAGDRNQLSAVRAGAVFSQLDALVSARVELKESVRFNEQSVVGRLAHAILEGQLISATLSADAVTLLDQIDWVVPQNMDANNALQAAWSDALTRGYGPLLDLIAQNGNDDAAALAVLQQLSQFRALTASHEGPFGTKLSHAFLTRWFGSRLRALRDGFNQAQFGRVITVTRNDELTGLRNGDIGVILNSQEGVRAVFEGTELNSLRWVALGLLPEHEDGLVLTVHKSQGSEYQSVLFALPQLGSPQARLELVYTAVTRAKNAIELFGTREQLCAAVAERSERFSGLEARLKTH